MKIEGRTERILAGERGACHYSRVPLCHLDIDVPTWYTFLINFIIHAIKT